MGESNMDTIAAERRPGRRPRLAERWDAHLHLDERHRAALEQLADAEGVTVSHVARRILDRALETGGRR